MTGRPRCGKPMLRYEAANGPMIDQPECGRPEGHNGMCRSTVALARQHAADVARIAAVRRAEGWRYSRSAAELGKAASRRRDAGAAEWPAPSPRRAA